MIRTGIEREGGITLDIYKGVVKADLRKFRAQAKLVLNLDALTETTPPQDPDDPRLRLGKWIEGYSNERNQVYEIYRRETDDTVVTRSGFPDVDYPYVPRSW